VLPPHAQLFVPPQPFDCPFCEQSAHALGVHAQVPSTVVDSPPHVMLV
jgi:hypothetical protein